MVGLIIASIRILVYELMKKKLYFSLVRLLPPQIPVDSVMAIVEHTEALLGVSTSTAPSPITAKTQEVPTAPKTGRKSKGKAPPHPALRCYDPFITFEDFCEKVLPGK